MIKIHKSKNGQYYFTVHAKNGAILVTSEMYTRKGNCIKGFDSMFRYAKRAWDYEDIVDTTVKKRRKAKDMDYGNNNNLDWGEDY